MDSIPSRSKRSGFTVVELVTVLLLLSILAVVGISRMMSGTAFVPAIVNQAVVAEVRFAQQLAASRHDTAVSLIVDRAGPDWRFQLVTDADGVVRTERIEARDTTVQVASGGASGALGGAVALTLRFAASGALSDVELAGVSGDAALGVDFTIAGGSVHHACVHPSGYVNDDVCV